MKPYAPPFHHNPRVLMETWPIRKLSICELLEVNGLRRVKQFSILFPFPFEHLSGV